MRIKIASQKEKLFPARKWWVWRIVLIASASRESLLITGYHGSFKPASASLEFLFRSGRVGSWQLNGRENGSKLFTERDFPPPAFTAYRKIATPSRCHVKRLASLAWKTLTKERPEFPFLASCGVFIYLKIIVPLKIENKLRYRDIVSCSEVGGGC